MDAVRGLLSFYTACSIGAVFNISVATLAFGAGVWWTFSSFLGAMAGSLFNYFITKRIIWKAHTPE
jgi:dolichol-phosphate mannosyltransferase